MNVRCDGCGKSYRIDPARLSGRDRARVQCPACRKVFEVAGPKAPTAAPPRAAAGPTVVRTTASGGKASPPARGPAGGDTTRNVKESELLSDSGKVRHGALALPAGKKVSLAVLSGPDQGRIAGIDRPRMVIGRADADIVVADPEASRQHAVVEAYGEVFVIRDLNSTNGTFVADQKIAAQEIGNQEEFRVGSSRMMLIVTAAEE